MAGIHQKIEILLMQNCADVWNSKLYNLLNGLCHQGDKSADLPERESCQNTMDLKVSSRNEPSSALGAADKVHIF